GLVHALRSVEEHGMTGGTRRERCGLVWIANGTPRNFAGHGDNRIPTQTHLPILGSYGDIAEEKRSVPLCAAKDRLAAQRVDKRSEVGDRIRAGGVVDPLDRGQ